MERGYGKLRTDLIAMTFYNRPLEGALKVRARRGLEKEGSISLVIRQLRVSIGKAYIDDIKKVTVVTFVDYSQAEVPAIVLIMPQSRYMEALGRILSESKALKEELEDFEEADKQTNVDLTGVFPD